MSRPLQAAFIPIPPQALASLQPIHAGASAGVYGEQDLITNIHWAQAYLTPQWGETPFNSDAGYLQGGGSVAYVIRSAWKRRIVDDLTSLFCVAYVSNTDGGNPGKIRFSVASTGATTGDITVAAGAAAWTRVTGTLALDTATARNVIRLEVSDPTAATYVRVRSVAFWPANLSSIAAGVTTDGFVAHDTLETSQDDPLTVYLRQTEVDNCDLLRRVRMDTLVCWAEDAAVRAGYHAYTTASTSYVTVARIPFRAQAGQDAIEWEANGYYTGASGNFQLTTGYMIQESIAAVGSTLGAAWASPYNNWVGDGGSTLTCLPEADDYIEVRIKAGAASNAYLMGLVAWFKDVDA